MSESKVDWLQRIADMHGLDPEDIEEIAEMCLEDTNDNIALLDDLSDMTESIRAAHSIKGSASNIGLAALSEAAKAIEMDLKSGDKSQVPAKVNNLRAAFEDFKVLLSS